MRTRSIELTGVFLAAALAAGCGHKDTGTPPGGEIKEETLVEKVPIKPVPGRTWSVLTIPRGTQGQLGDLRIGLGSVRAGSYVDAAGKKVPALLAGLWIYVRDDKSKNRVVDVHAGETVQLEKRSMYVEELQTGPRALVRLLFYPAVLASPSGG